MKNILLIIFYITLKLSAQPIINFDNYQQERDSLKKFQSILLEEKKLLQKNIDSLKKESSLIDGKIDLLNQEIENLYIKKFGREIGRRIYNKQVWKGMTEKMLLASWGKPDKIEKNVQKWGTFTQYYYGKITFYFRDSKLIDFEEGK